MKKTGLLFSLLFLLYGFSSAQSPVFEAFADARQVLANQYFELTFTLKNAEGSDFSPPAFNNFAILSGPARGISTTIINGKVSKEMSFTYTLQPRGPGNFTIGPASIQVNGQRLRTKPIKIEVLKAKEGTVPIDQQFFVQAELSSPEAYVGQQVRLDYKLYTTVEIQNYNIVEEPGYVGFYVEDIQRPDTRRRREIINGVQYVTRILKSIALYPQQAGTLTIDPAALQLGVIVNTGRSSSLFFGNEIRRTAVQTNPLNLNVKPLPEGAPASFSGAVGDFKMSSSISRQTITTDDAVSLVMNIEGDGDLKRVQVPEIAFPEPFTGYEPKVQETDLGELNSTRLGRKVIEYVAIPKEAGLYQLQPEFTFFHPDSSRYITLQGNIYELTVRPGTAIKTPIISTDDTEQADIHGLKMNTKLGKARSFLWGSALFWILLALPVLAILAAIFYKRRLQQIANIDPNLLKMQKAQKVAAQRLEQAAAYLQEQQSRPFYDEVSKAMMGYISDKLQIEKSQMNKSNMQQRLEELRIPEEQIKKFMKIVRNCEMALYAGKANPEAMEATYDHAHEVLATVEKHLAE